ncbi:MAG: YgjV family protein [Clostridia bacterium]|nr:YgjV family protein [Clostridia bacterium]
MQEIIGQMFGILAMVFSILTWQMNSHKKMMVMQIICASTFVVHYVLLGAYTGAVVNGVAVVRNIIFYHREKKIFSGVGWVILFAALMAVCGAVSGYREGWISLFMIVGMVINTLSLSCTNPQLVRKIILCSSPLMLVYNILTISIGGIINESLSMCSAVSALIRTAQTKKE